MKRGVISNSVFFIYGGVIIGLLFVLGFMFTARVASVGEKVDISTLSRQIAQDITRVHRDFGSLFVKQYRVGSDVDSVCFYDHESEFMFPCSVACSDLDQYPLIADSVSDTSNSLFFVGKGIYDAYDVDHVNLACCQFYCVDASDGVVSITYEGMGDATFVR